MYLRRREHCAPTGEIEEIGKPKISVYKINKKKEDCREKIENESKLDD